MYSSRTTLWPATAATRQPAWMVGLLVTLVLLLPAAAQAAPRATHIVQLRDGVTLADGAAAVRAARGRVTGRLPIIDALAVRLPRGARAELARDPRIDAVTVNGGIDPQDGDMLTIRDQPDSEPAPAADTGIGSDADLVPSADEGSDAEEAPQPAPDPAVEPPIDTSRIATAYP